MRYIEGALRDAGATAGNPDGTFIQRVPLVGARVTASNASIAFAGGDKLELALPSDVVVNARPLVPELRVDASDVVFVGYGVVAPEYGWDDFKGVDVRGKTLVMLVNDPQVTDPKDPVKLDDALFKGRAMTYYGRYDYKWESAAAHGAAAVLLVHETEMAGYPYEVVTASFSKENFAIAESAKSSALVTAWIHLDRAKALFRSAGKDFAAMKRDAIRKEFQPVPLAAKASFHLTTSLREVTSRNVIGKVQGTDPKLASPVELTGQKKLW